MLLVTRNCFKRPDASLSSRWSCGLSPRDVSRSWMRLKARTWSGPDRLFMGSARIMLLS
jgi:hypothetical protein